MKSGKVILGSLTGKGSGGAGVSAGTTRGRGRSIGGRRIGGGVIGPPKDIGVIGGGGGAARCSMGKGVGVIMPMAT